MYSALCSVFSTQKTASEGLPAQTGEAVWVFYQSYACKSMDQKKPPPGIIWIKFIYITPVRVKLFLLFYT